MKNLKRVFSAFNVLTAVALFCCITVVISSCGKKDPNSPGVEYMPDMYRGPAYEANSVNPNYADSMSDRKPVAGTIPRGFEPYPYPNDTAGYSAAGKYLRAPKEFPATPEIIEQGKVIFSKFCVECHGAEGKGDGLVGMKLPGPPPAYDGPLKDLPEGKMFHTITYGKGLMGSHASQLSKEQRWKVIRYVQTLQHHGAPVAADSSAAAKPVEAKVKVKANKKSK